MKPTSSARWRVEGLGIFALALLLIYFIGLSWRRWPDPIVDFGPQCYAIWRLSQGARIYHDFAWNYGPCSLYFDAALFRLFGPGIMVLVSANLVFYALILALAYVAFRQAWGPAGAFAALAVFIAVFSFSHLLAVGNYNYATPYAPEITHGMLLVLIAAILVVRWCRAPSRNVAFLVGLCGGFAAVLKPEFMLAMGALVVAAYDLRAAQGRRLGWDEFAALAAGGILPTIGFAAGFARSESLPSALIDAGQAWWLVLVKPAQAASLVQGNFLGVNHFWQNLIEETQATMLALFVMALIYLTGWLAVRPWPALMRIAAVLAAGVLIWRVALPGGWMEAGRCLPGLMAVLLVRMWRRLRREINKDGGKADDRTVMAFVLVLLAGAMLARMPLYARVYHFGFFQAALAGMVAAAALVTEAPRFSGANPWGRYAAILASLMLLTLGCAALAGQSYKIRVDQTEPVGSGRDRFYSTTRTIDGTGAVVNWAADQLRSAAPEAQVLVLPEGLMINYLSRHKSVDPGWLMGEKETDFVRRLTAKPPDYVVLITRDLTEFGIPRFGAPGNHGYELIKWVAANYSVEAGFGDDPLALDARPGAVIMKLKPK
jgi:hypothetical protein